MTSSVSVKEFVALGKKYQIEKLQVLCAEFMESDVNIDNVLEMYEMAPSLLDDKVKLRLSPASFLNTMRAARTSVSNSLKRTRRKSSKQKDSLISPSLGVLRTVSVFADI